MAIEELLSEIQSVPQDQLPHLLGQLRELESVAMARLLSPQPITNDGAGDRLLTIEQAAERLSTTTDYLYRHWKQLPFARKYPFGLRFSERGIAAYIRRGVRNSCTFVLTA